MMNLLQLKLKMSNLQYQEEQHKFASVQELLHVKSYFQIFFSN